MRGIIVFTLYNLRKGLFSRKKILVEEQPVLTNLYFQLQEEGEEEGGGRESCKIPHPIQRGRNK